jgi:hypothetical protein
MDCLLHEKKANVINKFKLVFNTSAKQIYEK